MHRCIYVSKSFQREGGRAPGTNMPAWYLLQLDPCLKYLNSATELPGDSVAQSVRAWQAICQVMGSSPSLNHCQFLFPCFFLFISFFLSDFDLG